MSMRWRHISLKKHFKKGISRRLIDKKQVGQVNEQSAKARQAGQANVPTLTVNILYCGLLQN